MPAATDDTQLAAILAILSGQFTVTCYCRLTPAARGNAEVAFRLGRGQRSVEICVDLFAQLLTPAEGLAAELARGAEVALQGRRGRARIARPRS